MTWSGTRDQRFWWGVVPILTLISLGKAIRLPNYNAATQAQIDYRFGFIKRGMFGSAFSKPLHLEIYERFTVFSWVMLLLMVVLLFVIAWRSGLRQRVANGEVVALFFSSYALTYMAHMVGYFEIVLTTLTVALLLIRRPGLRLLCSLPGSIFCILIHELFLIVFLPVLMLSFLLQSIDADETAHLGKERSREVAKAVFACALLCISCVGLTVRLALKAPMDAAQLGAMRVSIGSRVDFTPVENMYVPMGKSTRDNLIIMKGVIQHAGWWRQQLVCSITMAPTIVLLIMTTSLVLRSGIRPVPRWLRIFAVVAGSAPLGMHLLGYDVARFNALAILTSFLVLMVSCQFSSGARVTLSPRLRHCVLVVILLNMASGDLLMDGRVVRPFPFIRELPQVLSLLHGKWQARDPSYKPQY